MRDSRHSTLIGVDGGGTTCRLALVSGNRRIEATTGSANVTSDRAGAVTTLVDGLTSLAGKAGLGLADLRDCPAYFGLAGVVSPEHGAGIAAALPLSRVVVDDDRTTATVGALGQFDGAVVAVGTGSFVTHQTGGRVRHLGGWGLILGDEASGAWLGRGLLSEALRAEDGLVAHSGLTRAVLSEFGGAPGIVAHAATASPATFAALAPRIVNSDDATALRLVRAGAQYLEAALRAVGWTPAERLSLIGGLGPFYLAHLPEAVAARVTPPLGSALDGALALAARMAEAGT